MMKNAIVAFLLVFSMANTLCALSQEEEILVYNISLGGVIGGVGSLLNRQRGQTWYHALLKGFVQGSFGGIVSYQGKRLVCGINKHERLEYAWLSRIVHSTGASIIENAASNRNFWESWSIHIGFIRIESEPLHFSGRVKLLPHALLYGFVRASLIGRFDLGKSLRIGTPYFSTNGRIYDRYTGYSFWNYVIVDETYRRKYRTAAHECVHNLQSRDYMALNTIVDRKLKNNGMYKKWSHYIYPDIPFQGIPYALEGRHDDRWYFKNFFEMEAQYFATLKEVPIPRR